MNGFFVVVVLKLDLSKSFAAVMRLEKNHELLFDLKACVEESRADYETFSKCKNFVIQVF